MYCHSVATTISIYLLGKGIGPTIYIYIYICLFKLIKTMFVKLDRIRTHIYYHSRVTTILIIVQFVREEKGGYTKVYPVYAGENDCFEGSFVKDSKPNYRVDYMN